MHALKQTVGAACKDASFLAKFTLIVANQLTPGLTKELAAHCQKLEIPLVVRANVMLNRVCHISLTTAFLL